MALPRKYNTLIINALLAVVICLVVNFSYLLAIREQERRDFGAAPGWLPEGKDTSHTGILHISPDGYGYIICDDFPDAHTDSIYVIGRLIRRFSLQDGSQMKVIARDPRVPGANHQMWRVEEIDGVPFDYGELYDRPSDHGVMSLQLAYYLLYAFILLTVMTAGASRRTSMRFYLTRAAYAVVIAVILWLCLPVMRPRSGELVITAMNLPNVFQLDIMKFSFVLVFALLYGRTYQLIYQKEDILLENERLRYITLVNQINPHFLFNSLNSLSSLVREGKTDDALTYIDRLADTFRYAIHSEPTTTTTLGQELEFVGAYKYLLEVRYDEKLFIDIDVEPEKLAWMLPTFSIQPLIENAVKHNSITRSKPLHISIRTSGDFVVVSNPVNPKLSPEHGTGIGLENLSHRWQLLTGRGIEVSTDGGMFTVKLPFIK